MSVETLNPENALSGLQPFEQHVALLGQRLPEVQANADIISAAGQELQSEFGISNELFENPASTVIFSAIAMRYGQLEQNRGELDKGHYAREKEFIADSLMLLAGKNSVYYADMKDLIDKDDGIPKQRELEVYEKYTDTLLTSELKEAISTGLLDAVKERLGITPANEDEYDVRVLSVGDYFSSSDMMPRSSEVPGADEYSNPAFDEYLSDSRAYRQYQEDMEVRGKAFKEELGSESRIPIAWVTDVGGKRTLCMPMPTAEKILYKDEQRPSTYDEDSRKRDMATLEHEYVHTQGGLHIDHNVFFGIALEERRAEHYSGDKMGYQDIKGFFQDVRVATGFDVVDLFENFTKGGTTEEIYTALAEQFGLQLALEIVMTVPRAYIDDTRPLQKEVDAYLGGPDGVTKKLFERSMEQGKETEMNERIDKVAATILEIDDKSDFKDFWLSYRKMTSGLSFMTDKYATRINDLKREKAA